MTKSILFVLSSADKLLDGKTPTGWFLAEAAHPYEVLHDKVKITWASPKGGAAPLDPASIEFSKDDLVSKTFHNDSVAQEGVKNTIKLSDVKASDYDAIFYVGGHGPALDLYKDETSIKLISEFFEAGKPTAAVCHAPIVFNSVKGKDGKSILEGREVTAFSNAEEEAVKKVHQIPLLPEDSIKNNGGIYKKAAENWGTSVVVSDKDGKILITGQNPASAEGVGKALLKYLA